MRRWKSGKSVEKTKYNFIRFRAPFNLHHFHRLHLFLSSVEKSFKCWRRRWLLFFDRIKMSLSYFCNKFSHPLLTTSFTSFNFRLTLFFSCHRQKYFVVCRVSSWTRKNTIKNRISFGGLMCVQSNWFPLCSGFFVVCLLQELTKIEMFSFVCARACLWWSKHLNSFDNDTTKLSTSIRRWTLNGAPHFLYWMLFGALCEKIKQSFYSHRFASDGWQGHFVRWFCILLNEVECFLHSHKTSIEFLLDHRLLSTYKWGNVLLKHEWRQNAETINHHDVE